MARSPPNACSVEYLGWSTLSNMSTGIGVLQAPLLDLYVSFFTPTGPRALPATRLTLTDRGLIVTMDNNDNFYSMPNILLCKAVQLITPKTKDKTYDFAFESLNSSSRDCNLFLPLNKKYKYLTKLRHPPIVVCILRRPSGLKALDLHAFVCESHQQAAGISDWLISAQQDFNSEEINETGVMQYNPFPSQKDVNLQMLQEGGGKQRPATVYGNLSPPADVGRFPLAKETGKSGKSNITRHQSQAATRQSQVVLTQEDFCKPSSSGSGRAPTGLQIFDMSELNYADGMVASSREDKQGKHVQRSKTFNDNNSSNSSNSSSSVYQPVNFSPYANDEYSRGARNANSSSTQNLTAGKFYENLPDGRNPASSKFSEKSSSAWSLAVTNQMALTREPSLDESVGIYQDRAAANNPNGGNRDNRRPPDSLRMVMADARGRRPTVMPAKDNGKDLSERPNSVFVSSEYGSSAALSVAPLAKATGMPSPVPTPRHSVIQPVKPALQISSNEGKPIAMIQPQKVHGIKVLPSTVENLGGLKDKNVPTNTEGLYNCFVPAKDKEKLQEVKQEVRQEVRQEVKQEVKKEVKVDPFKVGRGNQDDPKKCANDFMSSNSDLYSRSAKFSLAASGAPVVDKSNKAPSVVGGVGNFGGARERHRSKDAVDKQGEQKDLKDAEMASMVGVLRFDQTLSTTLSPHGTNMEKALGYFP